jgi:transcriptional regulator with XRE-family HTH domain
MLTPAVIRTDLGLTQAQFASLLGHATSTVARWESGRTKPCPLSLTVMESIQTALPVDQAQRAKALDFLRSCVKNGGLYALLGKAFSAVLDRYATP